MADVVERADAGADAGASASAGPGAGEAGRGAVDLAARVAELEAELGRVRQEQWVGDALREASRRAGVEIARDDARLAGADPGDREAYHRALEAVVREEAARREAASEAETPRARVAELEAQLANPERNRFDTGATGSGTAGLSDASPLQKIAFGLGQR